MKKIIFVFSLIMFSAKLFAVSPDYFTFDLAAQGGANLDDMTLLVANSFGISYKFDSGVNAGFSFKKIDTITISNIRISIDVVENGTLSVLTGNDGTNMVFGAGFGYDFFTKKNKIFSSLGLYIDYLTTSGTGVTAPYSIENGGLLLFGLKTTMGI